MSNEEENNNNNDDDCCCLDVLRISDKFWNDYKHHSGKVAIALSILGGTSSIVVGFNAIAGSVALAITNSAVFFSAVCYEKLKSLNMALESDNHSLRRQTTLMNFRIGDGSTQQPSSTNDTPRTVDSTQYETVQPFRNAPNAFT